MKGPLVVWATRALEGLLGLNVEQDGVRAQHLEGLRKYEYAYAVAIRVDAVSRAREVRRQTRACTTFRIGSCSAAIADGQLSQPCTVRACYTAALSLHVSVCIRICTERVYRR